MRIRINKIIITISLLFLCNISYASDLLVCSGAPDIKEKYALCKGSPKNFVNEMSLVDWDNCCGKLFIMHKNIKNKNDAPVFEGKFSLGKPVNGTMIWKNPYEKYIGQFANYVFSGKGVLFRRDGKVILGNWSDGKFTSGNTYTLEEYKRLKPQKTIVENEEPIEEEANNDIVDISEAKSTCKDIGFKEGTEKFGECVLELTK